MEERLHATWQYDNRISSERNLGETMTEEDAITCRGYKISPSSFVLLLEKLLHK